MRSLLRRSVTLLALYAVALHILLLGFLPPELGSFSPIDPFAIICHTVDPSGGQGKPAQGKLQYLPGRAIDRCDLSSAVAPPPSPDESFRIDLQRTRLLDVLEPHSVGEHKSLVYPANLIRGPPQA